MAEQIKKTGNSKVKSQLVLTEQAKEPKNVRGTCFCLTEKKFEGYKC